MFQLHPQAWNVQPGHVLKLELLAQDSQYLRTPTGQQSVGVSDLQLRLPLVDAPGTDLGGLTVSAPAAKYLPAGYTLAREYATQTDGTRRRLRPRDVVTHARRPGLVRRVRAGRGAGVHGVHDGDGHLDRR